MTSALDPVYVRRRELSDVVLRRLGPISAQFFRLTLQTSVQGSSMPHVGDQATLRTIPALLFRANDL